MLIAGDVGGTKTRLALYEEGGTPQPKVEKTYVSDDFPHLEDIVSLFIQETGAKVSRGVFGMPGPVLDGIVKVTNLPWTVSEAKLQAKTSVGSVKLLNDLVATAYGIPFLPSQDLFALNDVPPRNDANKVVIAPGTGLGEAILFHHDGQYYASASEGGHTDFAPRNLFEIKLLQYLMGKFGHVSYERICSGIGIPHIYQYLLKHSELKENPELSKAIKKADDKTPLIVNAALNADSEVCTETLSCFVAILAAEAGNMALNTMAQGGVYLGGGIPPKILPALQDGTFMSAFIDKGRFSEVLSRVPVYVILNEKTALFGAACYALGL